RHLETIVGRNAPGGAFRVALGPIDILAAGSPVGGNGQLHCAEGIAHVNHLLDRAFAVTPLADDDRAVVVLQAGGHDFAGAGAGMVDQYRNGNSSEWGLARGPIGMVYLAVAAARGHDFTLGDEHVADVHGGLEGAAPIAAEIEHESA